MRLCEDDFRGIPLFNFVEYKIKSFYSKKSLEKRSEELSALIKKDLDNVDYFIKKWHEIHKPLVINWEGK